MHATWDVQDRYRWEAHTDAARVALQQSWAYGQAMQQLGVPCMRVALTESDAPKAPWLGTAQLIVQRLPWFARFCFALGGPVWAEGVNLEQQRRALEQLRRTLPLRRPRFALFSPPVALPVPNPEQAQSPAAHPDHTHREHAQTEPHAHTGRPRLTTGGSTVLLDLTQGEAALRAAQEGRWRNRLNAAERSPLKVRVCGSRPSDYRWLVEAESTQRQERRYIALPAGFVEAFQNASRKPSLALLTLAAELKGQPCAGMMFLVHGSSAAYHLGWTDDAGREHSAHNLLLWRACALLAERGVAQLDLGGVNTVQNPGLARFKMGSGGRVVTWVGTYI